MSRVRSIEHPEIVVPGSDDAPGAGDEEKYPDERVSYGGAVTVELRPFGGGIEGECGKGKKDYSNADSDRGKDGPGHVRATWRSGYERIGPAESISRRPFGLGADPGFELAANSTIGGGIAAHTPG